jgi:hypothetical protein
MDDATTDKNAMSRRIHGSMGNARTQVAAMLGLEPVETLAQMGHGGGMPGPEFDLEIALVSGMEIPTLTTDSED